MAIKYEGVYSSSKNFGENYSKNAYRKFYWLVWSVDDYAEEYLIHQLDASLNPLYQPFTVKKAIFLSNAMLEKRVTHVPSPDLTKSKDFMALASHIQNNIGDVKVKIAFDNLGNSLLDNLEDSYLDDIFETDNNDVKSIIEIDQEAKKVDTEMRSEFAIALINFRQGKKDQAVEIFSALAKESKGIHPAHKHMFTDFAVGLRKCKLTNLALEHSLRAVALAPDDAHAYFNAARLYFELGKKTEALSYISTALTLDPKLEVARKLLVALNKKTSNNIISDSGAHSNHNLSFINRFSKTIYKYK